MGKSHLSILRSEIYPTGGLTTLLVGEDRLNKRRQTLSILFGLPFSLKLAVLACLLLLPLQAATYALAGDSQSLGQAANDPTASLMSLQIQDSYSGDFHQLKDEDANTIILRPVVPFTIGEFKNIARATIPFITHNPTGKTGLGDSVLFDLIVFPQSWGRWGLGPVMLLPTASKDELGAEKWALGPAIGFVAQEEKLIWGLFNQNLFTFAGDDTRKDVNVSILQPIVNIPLPHKWFIGTSEMNMTYDWETNDWTNLPLGIKLSKLVKFDTMPVLFSSYYEYNFQDDFVAPEWTVNVTAKFLFPI